MVDAIEELLQAPTLPPGADTGLMAARSYVHDGYVPTVTIANVVEHEDGTLDVEALAMFGTADDSWGYTFRVTMNKDGVVL